MRMCGPILPTSSVQPIVTLAFPPMPVRLVSVHAFTPKRPCLPPGVSRWRDDLALLADLPVPSGPADPPTIVAGDFNSTLDHACFRRLLRGRLADAARETGRGLMPTWSPAPHWPVALLAIDHILVDRRCAVLDTSVHRLAGTDHRAVFARVRLPEHPYGRPGPPEDWRRLVHAQGLEPEHGPEERQGSSARPASQTYRPDDFDCTGAVFAKPGVRVREVPAAARTSTSPRHKPATRLARVCKAGACTKQLEHDVGADRGGQPAGAVLPAVHALRGPDAGEPHLRRLPRRLRHHDQAGCNGVVREHEPHQLGARPAHAGQDSTR